MGYENLDNYLVTKELLLAINSAKSLKKPLLIKCEPETNKEELLEAITANLCTDYVLWELSNKKELLGSFLEVKLQLWQICANNKSPILWINGLENGEKRVVKGLLKELMNFQLVTFETEGMIKLPITPIIIITVDCGKDLSESFLRSCFFYYLRFPCKKELIEMAERHFPYIEKPIIDNSIEFFLSLRAAFKLIKQPCISEFIDWLNLVVSDKQAQNIMLENRLDEIPQLGALLKNEQDLTLVEKSGGIFTDSKKK